MEDDKSELNFKIRLPKNGPFVTLFGLALGLASFYTPTIGQDQNSFWYHSIDVSALALGSIIFLVGIRIMAKRNYNVSIWRFLGRFILSGIFSIIFGLLMFPFMTEAGGKPVEEMAKIGGQNMNRVVVLFGLMTGMFTYISYHKNRFRLTALFLIMYWIFGTTLVFSLNRFDNQKPEPQEQAANRNNCNEQDTLVKTKNCTVLVIADGGKAHGTGFSVKPGYIVTNKHVIEGGKKFTTWWNGSERQISIWNYSDDDLAVMKHDLDIPTCDWSDSSQTELAGTVYAIGWPLDPSGDSTITKGIFSRLMNTEEGTEFVQTDAAINPGNSGGPLTDKCGIIGINNWKIAVEGIDNFAFAISSNFAKSKIDGLITSGSTNKVAPKTTPQYKYKPDNSTNQGGSSNTFYFTADQVSNWTKALTRTREMSGYWNGVSAGNYDQNKLNQLKDVLARMSAALETVVPKIQAGQDITQAENQLLGNWNNMLNSAVAIEGELDGHSYTNGYYHYECKNNSCATVNTRGKNTCSSYNDCAKKYHYTCQNDSCVYVEGEGTNDCYISSDCYHSVCDNGACKRVSGKGTTECYGDYSCYHSECQGTSCVKVNSPGTTTCYSNYSCGGSY